MELGFASVYTSKSDFYSFVWGGAGKCMNFIACINDSCDLGGSELTTFLIGATVAEMTSKE